MNGRLRFLILKAQLSDTFSQWLARQLPRQVVLFATLHLWAAVGGEEVTLPEAVARWQRSQVR